MNTSDNSGLSVASSSSGTMTPDDKGGTEARTHNNVVAADKPSTDKQLDILNIQVTRQIQPSSKADSDLMASSPVKATTLKREMTQKCNRLRQSCYRRSSRQ